MVAYVFKQIVIGSLLSLTIAGAAVSAPNSQQVNAGVSMRGDRLITYSSYVAALSGNIREDGAQIRLNLGYGNFPNDGRADSERTSTDALLGYQVVKGIWKTRGYIGLAYVDRTNETEQIGGKIHVSTQTSISGEYTMYAAASYSMVENQYSSVINAGKRFGSVFIGPEIMFFSSDRFESQRIGLAVKGVKLDQLSLSLTAGYAFNGAEDQTSGDEAYVTLSANRQF